jgi:hypothetical protein
MKNEPIKKYCNITHTQLSIARYYGGMTVNGHEYDYDPTDDSLNLREKKKKKVKGSHEGEGES